MDVYTKSKGTSDKWAKLKSESLWNVSPQPPCFAVGCKALWFFFKVERFLFFFRSWPKAFKCIPSASKSDKRRGRFCAPLRLLLLPLCFSLFLSFSESEGPCLEAESTFQMQTPLPLFRSTSFCPLPMCFLFPLVGLLCALCDVCPSPIRLYPLCAPKGPGACCCSLKRLRGRFGATL